MYKIYVTNKSTFVDINKYYSLEGFTTENITTKELTKHYSKLIQEV